MVTMQPGCPNIDREAAGSMGIRGAKDCRRVNGGHPAGDEGNETQMFSSEHCRQINIK